MIASNIIGIGYNGASHIDEGRLFATWCHFGHSIGVSVVGRRPIISEINCFRKQSVDIICINVATTVSVV